MDAFVGTLVTKVVDYTVAAIGRQLGYIIFYKKNLDDLVKKCDDLDGLREKVQNMVNVEENKYCKIQVDVKPWLEKANDQIIKTKVSEDNANKMSSPHCFNLIQRHKLGRKAKKMVEEINEIIEKGNTFDQVGYPLPLPNIDSSSIPGYQYIASRLSIAKDIKDALADTNNSKVGIHGMGGVGKTMLVKEVERLLKEDNLFDPVITLTIGQSIDVKGIQEKMRERLRLKFTEESVEARAALLRNNLMKMEKILIVLDDLWNKLKLEDVGIPCGCKILITSRDKDVLTNEMGVETDFQVKSLSETEAWEFFKNKIGEIDKNSIEPIAMQVAKKCGGLPIALDTVGNTLKGKTLGIWKDSLKQLQNPSGVMIKGVTTEVYGSLRLSYDFIQNDEAKLIFLLCSVFPDDYEIPLESLSMYAMGIRLLNGVDTLEEARYRIEALVDVLKSSSLLLESGRSVKMHDVVRDVAIYISSEEGCQMSTFCCGYEESEWRDKCGSYRAIFTNYDGFLNLPQDLKFPKLELLILISGITYERKELHQTFFAGMEKLLVLDLSNMCFPQLTTSLRNLRTFCMKGCEFKDIDIIGEFKELEVLRFDNCRIKELPKTMSQLTKLKVLNVSAGADRLDVIPPNVISKMMNLEELSLLDFEGWGKEVVYKGKSIKNAKLSEFKYLPHLSSLNLTIPCVNSLSDLSFSVNLKLDRFHIHVGRHISAIKQKELSRYLNIHIESETVLNDVVDKVVLKRCDELRLEGSVGITNLLFKSNGNYGYPDLRYLSLQNNSDMRHVIGDQPRNCGVNYFSSLDTLNLQRMESLENIVHMDIRRPDHFNKLRVINVNECKQLKNIFSFLVFEGLSNLHKIKVCACDLMDGLILMENEEGNVKTKCSIVSLEFCRVPQLTSFCSKKLTNQHRDNLIPFFDDQVSFPELESLKFEQASNLKMLWHNSRMISNSFCKLKSISILDCDNLRYMFPCSAITTLVSLDDLFIERCKSLEAIFEMEEPFIVKENDVALSKLSSVRVAGCRKLKSVFPASIKRLQQLQTLEIRGACELLSEDKTLEIAQSNSSLFHEIAFPELETLVFEEASNFKMLWKNHGMISNSCCKLQRINIYNYDDLRYIFPYSAMTRLVSLEVLEIKRCKSLEAIFEMEETNIVKENDVALPNLSYVSVRGCPKLKSVFPASIKRLPQLQALEIMGACKLFSKDKTLEIAQSNSSPFHEDQIVFPNLISLRMSYKAMKINSLVTQFSRADSFPKLKFLTLKGKGSSDDDDYDDWITLPLGFRQGLFSTENLKIYDVWVWKDNTDIWKMFFDHLELPNSIKFNLFLNLKSLSIEQCNGLKNLLNSSVVKRLVNLESMRITKCGGMISILDGDGDGNEEEEIIFNKLVELELTVLERLESFHSGKSKLMFPCLERLAIQKCYKMKIFSNGIIRKPNLRDLNTGGRDIFKEEEEEVSPHIGGHDIFKEEEEEEEKEEEEEEGRRGL